MKRIALAAMSFAMVMMGVQAASASCTTDAGDKKLAGAAKTSFMKKCETDAATKCDASAAEKKLNGAAKTSFTKKCVSDATGVK